MGKTRGIEIRRAVPADALAVARVHVRSWQAGYRGIIADAVLDGLRPEDRAARYTFDATGDDVPRTHVATADGTIVGFATTSPSRDADRPAHGELCALYVDPAAWGTGAGRALIGAARADLAARGFAAALLWVLDGNDRAERFYRADGWVPDDNVRREDIWGVSVAEHRLERRLP